MNLFKAAVRAGLVIMGVVAVIALFVPYVAMVVHGLLVGAVAAVILVPAAVLVSRSVSVIRARRLVARAVGIEREAADYAYLAAHSRPATLRESA